MTVLQTNIPVTSQTIFFSLVNDEQIPGHSVVSMFVRHTAVHVFVCGREHHIHYTAAVKEEGITAGECPVTSTGGLKCTHTHAHMCTHKTKTLENDVCVFRLGSVTSIRLGKYIIIVLKSCFCENIAYN